MYLKTLEIQGFKSFADKTVFEFAEGVTGIVGPNGAGKSTLYNLITGLYSFEGSILFNKQEISSLAPGGPGATPKGKK